MLERLAEQRVAIYAVIHDPAITKPEHRHLDLKDTQWDLLSQMVVVLKPLQIATTQILMCHVQSSTQSSMGFSVTI